MVQNPICVFVNICCVGELNLCFCEYFCVVFFVSWVAVDLISTCVGTPTTTTKMVDVAALVIAVVLFVILSPGLLLQIPGDERPLEFTNSKTSVASIIVHAVVFAILFYLLQLLFHVHGGV
jgi:hypothetical protein